MRLLPSVRKVLLFAERPQFAVPYYLPISSELQILKHSTQAKCRQLNQFGHLRSRIKMQLGVSPDPDLMAAPAKAAAIHNSFDFHFYSDWRSLTFIQLYCRSEPNLRPPNLHHLSGLKFLIYKTIQIEIWRLRALSR